MRWRAVSEHLVIFLLGCDPPATESEELPLHSSPPTKSAAPHRVDQPSTAPPPASQSSFLGFREISEEAGLTKPQRGGEDPPRTILDVKSIGLATFDFDQDGRLDLFLTAGSTLERFNRGDAGFPCRLYRNLGDLRFEEVIDRGGLPEFRWANGVAAGDLDGDGRDDLIVTGLGKDRVFLRRDEGFQEVVDAGLSQEGWSTSAALADLDLDGDLDLYIARYLEIDPVNPPIDGDGRSCLWENQGVICGPRGLPPTADSVYAGNGDGTFRDVTAEWGFDQGRPGYGLAVVIADLIGDRAPEIFVANDSSPNFLWSRDGNRWRDIGFVSGVSVDLDGEEQAGMGADVGDLDGDGRLDLAVTNFEQENENLYRGTASGSFFDRAEAWGISRASRPTLSWGIGIEDFDLDGQLDLFVANGHVYPESDLVSSSPGYAQRDQFYRRVSPPGKQPRFQEQGKEWGITEKTISRGALFADLDDDGDVDIVVSHLNGAPALYENLGASDASSLQIRLEQPDSKNRDAIGAIVSVQYGTWRFVESVQRQSSFLSSNDPRITRGIPPSLATVAGEVTVRWPEGAEEKFSLPAGGGPITLVRGTGVAVPSEN